jgi:hypothetical protein
MRQPLRMVSSYMQLLEKSLTDQLDGEQRGYFDFAIDGARRMDGMMLGLLDYSRVGRKGEPPAWIESRALLDDALLFLEPAIAEAQATIRIEGEWPKILVSPDEMLRLVQNLIGNALISLQEWPEQREQLKADLKAATTHEDRDQIMGLAVDEFLRFESSNQLSNRRALQATQVNGVDLPAGALVTLCIGAANRDPAVYEKPEQLDPRRTGNKHLAFGFGVHQCAGLSLARLEGRIAIGRFLQRFPDYKLTQAPVRGGRARFRGFLYAPFSTL